MTHALDPASISFIPVPVKHTRLACPLRQCLLCSHSMKQLLECGAAGRLISCHFCFAAVMQKSLDKLEMIASGSVHFVMKLVLQSCIAAFSPALANC